LIISYEKEGVIEKLVKDFRPNSAKFFFRQDGKCYQLSSPSYEPSGGADWIDIRIYLVSNSYCN
jgi:hypothetical protein